MPHGFIERCAHCNSKLGLRALGDGAQHGMGFSLTKGHVWITEGQRLAHTGTRVLWKQRVGVVSSHIKGKCVRG